MFKPLAGLTIILLVSNIFDTCFFSLRNTQIVYLNIESEFLSKYDVRIKNSNFYVLNLRILYFDRYVYCFFFFQKSFI